MPPDPPEKFRLRRLRCPSPRKILLFHKISLEALHEMLHVVSKLVKIYLEDLP